MDSKSLLRKVIPPNDYQHREGFSNIEVIDKLKDHERIELEANLINMLNQSSSNVDILIVTTLAYLKSTKSLPY